LKEFVVGGAFEKGLVPVPLDGKGTFDKPGPLKILGRNFVTGMGFRLVQPVGS
jgi:hypothetical protein